MKIIWWVTEMIHQAGLGLALTLGVLLQLIGLMIVGFLYKDQPNEKDNSTNPGNQDALMANLIIISIMTLMWMTLGVFAFQPSTSQWIQKTFTGLSYGLCSLVFLVIMGLTSFITLTVTKKTSNAEMKTRLDSAMVFQICGLIGPLFILYMLWSTEPQKTGLTGIKSRELQEQNL